MIYVAGCNNTLNYFPYERNEDHRDWTVVLEPIFIYSGFLKQWINERIFENG